MIEYLKVGQIVNTHGIKGEVKVYPLTDDVMRFKRLKFVFVKNDETYNRVDIESVKFLKDFPILKLSGINTMNDAEKYKEVYIYVDRDNAVKLPEDTYFIADLIGIDVETIEGEKVGKITSVFSTGSNDVYEIRMDDGKDILLPAIKDVVKNIDIQKRKMLVVLLEGLL